MAMSTATVRAWLSGHRLQAEALGVCALAVAAAVVIGVRARRAAEPARLENGRLRQSASEVASFRKAFTPAAAEQDVRIARLNDSLGVAVSRDNRVALAQQIAARAESLGLTGVRVKFAGVDSAAAPTRPETSGGSIIVADYSLVIECDGTLANVLALVNELPASVAVQRISAAQDRSAAQFRLVLGVFEQAGASPAVAKNG